MGRVRTFLKSEDYKLIKGIVLGVLTLWAVTLLPKEAQDAGAAAILSGMIFYAYGKSSREH